MKSLKSLLLGLLFAASVSLVVYAASPTQVTVSTVAANGTGNGAAAFTAAGYPQITGTVKIRKLYLSNVLGTEAVDVTLYKNCTSSTAATAVWTGIVGSSAVVNVDWLPLGMAITSPCLNKGSNSGAGTVKAHISYE